MSAIRYNVTMIRDFLDHLWLELLLIHMETTFGLGASDDIELTEEATEYRTQYGCRLLRRLQVVQDGVSKEEYEEAQGGYRRMAQVKRKTQLETFECLNDLFEEALDGAAFAQERQQGTFSKEVSASLYFGREPGLNTNDEMLHRILHYSFGDMNLLVESPEQAAAFVSKFRTTWKRIPIEDRRLMRKWFEIQGTPPLVILADRHPALRGGTLGACCFTVAESGADQCLTIVFWRSLLRMASAAEIVGVIAHEIAHFYLWAHLGDPDHWEGGADRILSEWGFGSETRALDRADHLFTRAYVDQPPAEPEGS
ncbi:MAG: M48 family metalloprotease [Deltaproteobacteria bacterium]|nr:M48 family metalloprotease [Deltaproteobacteria bacterium]